MADVVTACIFYKNWRGEEDFRGVMPRWVWFGTTQWHPQPQWFLKAYDFSKKAERDFAMSEITLWSNGPTISEEEANAQG